MSERQTVEITSVNMTENGLSLKGSLFFSTIYSLLSEGGSLLENHNADSISIDMLNVEKIDSAGITLLLAWKRLCDTQNKKFQIINAKKQAVSLITTNKLQDILAVS